MYQWGRYSNGHEKRDSSTTALDDFSLMDVLGHGDFIITNSSPWDWRSSQNDNLWQDSDINTPCPAGFRLPTETEWEAERTSWSSDNAAGAFASPLKLVLAGHRYYTDGIHYNDGGSGGYWSSMVDGGTSRTLYFASGYAVMTSYYRAYRFSVRCLKD